MSEKCVCCGERTLAIVKHHISYYPEKIIEICANCHFIIHNPPSEPEYFECLPKIIRELIKANIQRKNENEKTLGKSLDSNEIEFEVQKERLILMKLINRHWELRNWEMFSKLFPSTNTFEPTSVGDLKFLRKDPRFPKEEVQRVCRKES